MIDEVLWNLGPLSGIPGGGLACYEAEKATGVTWSGKVGLFAPSDYKYSGGWIKQLSSSSNSNSQWTMFTDPQVGQAWYLALGGWFEETWSGKGENMYAFPTIYLKPEVNIISGDGTPSNPFKFAL